MRINTWRSRLDFALVIVLMQACVVQPGVLSFG